MAVGRLLAAMLFGAVALFNGGCQMFSRHPTNAATDLAPSAAPIKATRVEQSPAETAKLRFAAAQQMDMAGNFKEAIALYENARQADARFRDAATRRLGVLYDKNGDFDKARVEYEQTLRNHPNDAETLNNLGYGYYSRGQWATAEEYLRKAVAANPQHPSAWINLGMTLAQQDRTDESLEAFSRVISPAQGQCNLAFILMTQGKRAEAKEAYREALRMDPTLQLAQGALAKLEGAAAPEGVFREAQSPRRRPMATALPDPAAPTVDEQPIVIDPALAPASDTAPTP